MSRSKPLVHLVQLPIPPAGLAPVWANVPLAAGYLKLLARKRRLEDAYEIDILPAGAANRLGDRGLVEAIAARRPWLVGFTCYLWNVERTLWVAERVKEVLPGARVLVGGPEITSDNAWVLRHASVDYAALGEGEQTFVELLAALRSGRELTAIDGLAVRAVDHTPRFRQPLAVLDEISSPYLEGILDAADEKLLLLETVRGCRFRCKFCYYPKSYDALYFLSPERIAANLRYAAERGVEEVVLLDPTLNQRRDFADFLRLLAAHNPAGQFTYSAELRAEGITAETAHLLREANFTEVEVGLQSVGAAAQKLMDRTVNLRAFERGVRAMLDAGIRVRTDLIIGLPGDTADTVRAGIDYLVSSGLFSEIQVFHLSVLPGTAFRQEAAALGLKYQSRPPYYVLQTPTLGLDDLYGLMEEAQEAFGVELDLFPPPELESPSDEAGLVRALHVDLDCAPAPLPPPAHWTQALTLRFTAADFRERAGQAADFIRCVLSANPHTTLEVLLDATAAPERIDGELLDGLLTACAHSTSYLDLYYSLHPNHLLRAKRLVVIANGTDRARLGSTWIDEVSRFASIAWRGGGLDSSNLGPQEHALRRLFTPTPAVG